MSLSGRVWVGALGVLPVLAAVSGGVGLRIFGGCEYSIVEATKARLQMQVSAFVLDVGRPPTDIEELVRDSGINGWAGPYARARDLVDPWGRRFFYRTTVDGKGFQVLSLGRDGRLGGDGPDADIELFEPNS